MQIMPNNTNSEPSQMQALLNLIKSSKTIREDKLRIMIEDSSGDRYIIGKFRLQPKPSETVQ